MSGNSLQDIGIEANSDRAIVVYGVSIEGAWDYPRGVIFLDEYSVERQAITGHCWRFNRMKASVAPVPGKLEYFVFDVEPGHYVYSRFSSAINPLRNRNVEAYAVSAGRITYIGDFIYARDKAVDVRRDLDAAKTALKQLYPGIKGEFVLADALPVSAPTMFLCAP
jgi:hypothetical protein